MTIAPCIDHATQPEPNGRSLLVYCGTTGSIRVQRKIAFALVGGVGLALLGGFMLADAIAGATVGAIVGSALGYAYGRLKEEA
jgi:membrane protein DedA with SNARE-associated domain